MLYRSNAESFDDQPKKEKLYMKKKGIGSDARAERMSTADTDLQLLGEAERGRHLQKQKKRRLQGREDDVCCEIRSVFPASLCMYHSIRFTKSLSTCLLLIL